MEQDDRGDCPIADLFGIDATIVVHITTIIGFLGRHETTYPDIFDRAARQLQYSPSCLRKVMIVGMAELDPHTLRVAASLVRSRIARLKLDPRMDGLERLGAHRTLTQLAVDLEVSADHAQPSCGRRSR